MTAFPYMQSHLSGYIPTRVIQYRAAVCKHLVASIQGIAVLLAITKRDPRVYVEISRSFTYLWAPGLMNQPALESQSEHFSLEVIPQWNVSCHYVSVKTRRIHLLPTHAKGQPRMFD